MPFEWQTNKLVTIFKGKSDVKMVTDTENEAGKACYKDC